MYPQEKEGKGKKDDNKDDEETLLMDFLNDDLFF